ncbi:ROK family protein [Virgibacillus kekensis]|uniref:ROK family protein n=1 Tax=Virgibacillus kekensis TaxID=202261 RepID=A0ABV9DHU0_9BACI
MEERSIGIDIGGTKIAAGLVNQDGEVVCKKIYPTPKESSQMVLECIKEIVTRSTLYAEKEGIKLVGVGIGSAGQVDYKAGKILSGTDNIKDWNDIHIYNFLKRYTDLPIWLDNDANTFAIAEYALGNAKGTEDLICLTLGTGVGGGVISNGRMVRGKWGGAAELGHITVDMNGPACNCGSNGCLEVYASGTGIANRMREKLSRTDVSSYTENPNLLTSKEVFQLYDQGLPLAKETIDQAIQALSYGIVSLIHTFNPSVVVLGGGLVKERDWIAKAIKNSIQDKGMTSLIRSVDIVISNLGYDAGLIGAAYQAWFHKKVD